MMVLPMGPWGGGISSGYQIPNSLLFHGGQKLYRSFTSSSTWGLSVWVRRNVLGTVNPILGSAVKFNSSDTLTAGSLTTTAVYRDTTAWMHISIAGSHLWVNGVDMGATTTSAFTCSSTNCLGYDGTSYLNAEIAEFTFIDGTQTSSAPGRADSVTGSWCPLPVSATWGTNGCYLGKPWDFSNLGTDYSGHGNNWTPSGFAASDVLSDSPTNVFTALNPLDKSPVQAPFQNGNLKIVGNPGSFFNGGGKSSVSVRSGKWYWEITINSLYATNGYQAYGVYDASYSPTNVTSDTATAFAGLSSGYPGGCWYPISGYVYNNGTTTSFPGSIAANDIVMVAIDADTNKIWFGKNGTWLNSGNPTNGTSPAMTLVGSNGWAPAVGCYTTADSATVNFGQTQVAYTPPAGFKALCTANMPATTGASSGSFTGNANVDGPCVYTGAVPQSLTVNGNAVTWGTHADKLATGFKLRTASTSYNSTGTNNWTATYSIPQKPTVGSNKVPSNAQGN